jgi:phosphate acyltransferase
LFGLEQPTVGLLNVGVEEIKGNEAVKEAGRMLREIHLPIHFHGNVEGDDISKGTVDVVVTEGFTGNVALKTAEGTAKQINSFLKAALSSTLFSKLGAFMAQGAFRALKEKLDPRKHNGGVFVGLNGVVVKSHGGTDALGFATAIDVAIEMVKNGLVAKIAEDAAQLNSIPAHVAKAAE